MRLEQMPVNISLIAMLPVAFAVFAIRRRFLKIFGIAFGTLVLLDLIGNLIGLGAFFWWSPVHWPSTITFGVDEIVETHGVTATTLGYILDLVIWAAIITAIVSALKKKTSQPCAAPLNGGPAASVGNSNAPGGPLSVS